MKACAMSTMPFGWLCVYLFSVSFGASAQLIRDYGSYATPAPSKDVIKWCTITVQEQTKCQRVMMVVERDKGLFGSDYLHLECKQAFDADECMTWLDEQEADILMLDAGQVFVAGRYHSLVPIMQEVFEGGFAYSYSVAVVKRNSSLPNESAGGAASLRHAKACFPIVGSLTGWVLPVYRLMQEGGMEILDCNNHVKSAIGYFGESCAPNSLTDKYNPIGDNSDQLCSLCAGTISSGHRCSSNDPYAGSAGSIRCLMEKGDIAFMDHFTPTYVLNNHPDFNSVSVDVVELFCPDGRRRALSDYQSCNWGRAPSGAIVTSSAHDQDERIRYQRFITKMLDLYGQPDLLIRNNSSTTNNRNPYDSNYGPQQDRFNNPYEDRNRFTGERDQFGNPIQGRQYEPTENEYGGRGWNDSFLNSGGRNRNVNQPETNLGPDQQNQNQSIEHFKLFNSVTFGQTDLLLHDATRSLRKIIEADQSAANLLGTTQAALLGVRSCPLNSATLCLTSDVEQNKCARMRTALKAQLLTPSLVCYRGHSAAECARAVAGGNADIAILDAADVESAGRKYGLVPFMQEIYGDGHGYYYAVAVAKEEDPDTEITYLRGKNTCHSGISTAAGWIYPLAYLIANGWIRSYGCDGAKAASEYFSKSCVPGALSSEYTSSLPHDNLCHLCHGASFRRCRRDASEDYFGDVGALRCLVEGGGDVAFVRHSTALQVAGGRRREWWSRNTLRDDFQLLCPDGTRAMITEYKRCNLGRVSSVALVGRPNNTQLDIYANLMVYAQQFYGSLAGDEFSFGMFQSPEPYSDLIFSDTARRLRVLPNEERDARKYVGPDLLRAARIVDCDAGHY